MGKTRKDKRGGHDNTPIGWPRSMDHVVKNDGWADVTGPRGKRYVKRLGSKLRRQIKIEGERRDD